jgi:hypothetical protein
VFEQNIERGMLYHQMTIYIAVDSMLFHECQ